MEKEILENLKRALLDYNAEDSAKWAKKAVEEKIDPVKAIDALIEAIRKVGDSFGKGECWLPDLIGAADAMQSAMPILEREIKRRGTKRESMGKVVIGSVFGDIHNIGKSMVTSLLTADGFEVVDLGIDIPTEKFVEAVKEHKPDILAMSALLTTTAPEGKKVIDRLKEVGLRDKVKVIIGGGAINADFARSIGADGYDPTAPGAVGLSRSLLGK
jgi:corrinoid protein of di/trimethylamine methyltransferase